MNTLTNSELNILNKSVAQFTHFVTADHRTRNAHLLGAKVSMMAADAPPPADTPSTTDLNTILNNAVTTPGTTSIVSVATSPDDPMLQMLSQVQTLDSYISLLTAYCIYNEHPKPYDPTVPADASAFTRAMAKWRSYVMTGGNVKAMAGYMPVSAITTQSFSKSVTSGTLHIEFLAEIFGSFEFPPKVLSELDSILTKVVGKLGAVDFSFETQSDTVDHFLTYYYFSTVAGTGGAGQPPKMYVPNVRVFFLHIDQSSWKASLGKSSVTNFSFDMNFFDMDTTMNPALVANDMTTINSTISTLTGKTAAEVNAVMNMQAIRSDPQSS